jgi:hypothetical protein
MSYKKSDYSKKLEDPRWQRKRLEILNRDGFQCQICDDTSTQLHIHHRFYISGREPWDYAGFAYVTVCKTCHERIKETAHEGVGECTWQGWEYALDAMCNSKPGDLAILCDDVRCEGVSNSEIAATVREAITKLLDEKRRAVCHSDS